MRTSDSITKIAPALVKALTEVQNATKDAKNPHFRSDYASLKSVLDTAKPVLASHGIVVLQGPGWDGEVCTLTTTFLHESGEWVESTAGAPVAKADPQGVGSAITYLRRYSLAAMAGITQEDDDGNAASHAPAQQYSRPQATQSAPRAPAPSGQGFDLDAPVGFGKYKAATWRFLLQNDPDYVEWVVGNMEKLRPETRDGLTAALANTEVAALATGHDEPWPDQS